MNIIEGGVRVLTALGIASTMACGRAQPVVPETKILPAKIELPELKQTSIEAYFRRSDLENPRGALKILQPGLVGVLNMMDWYDVGNFCPAGSTQWRITNKGLHNHGILESGNPVVKEMKQGGITLFIGEDEPNGYYRGKSIISCNPRGSFYPAAEIDYEIFLTP